MNYCRHDVAYMSTATEFQCHKLESISTMGARGVRGGYIVS